MIVFVKLGDEGMASVFDHQQERLILSVPNAVVARRFTRGETSGLFHASIGEKTGVLEIGERA